MISALLYRLDLVESYMRESSYRRLSFKLDNAVKTQQKMPASSRSTVYRHSINTYVNTFVAGRSVLDARQLPTQDTGCAPIPSTTNPTQHA
eukprot:4613703-Amphidinium_carterae.2